MANQYKQNRQARKGGGQQEQRTSQVELADVYGEQLFTPLEQLVRQLAQKVVQLENGDFVTIKEAAGETVAAEAQRLREIIGNSGEQRRDLVNWASTAITSSFPEDQQENAFCLILPGQAKRHQFIVDLSALMTKNGRETKIIVESKQNVRAMLVAFDAVAQEFEAKINKKFPDLPSPYGAYRSSVPEGTTPMTMGEYLKTKADVHEKREVAKLELGEAKGKAKWLSNWVEGKPRPGKLGADAQADKKHTAIEAKRSEIEALKVKISSVQADESRMAGLRNYSKAGEYAAEWQGLQSKELPRLEAELAAMEQVDELKTRVEAAAQVVAGAPDVAIGTFPAPEIGKAAAKVAAQGKPVVDFAAEIGRLETEIQNQTAAVEKHEAEAKRLSLEGRAIEDLLAAAQMLNDARLERGRAESARAFAAKATAELMELIKAASEASKSVAVVAAPAPLSVTQATTVAIASTDTTDDPVLFLEAVLEESDDTELTKATAGLLNAVRLAYAANKGAKRIGKAIARFQSEEVDVEAVIADTEALLELAK